MMFICSFKCFNKGYIDYSSYIFICLIYLIEEYSMLRKSIQQKYWGQIKGRQMGHYVMVSRRCESLLTNPRFHFILE